MSSLSVNSINNELRVDSRAIAIELGVKHKNFFQTVKDYETLLKQEFGILPFQTEEIKGRGQPEKYALLNEDQATFLMTLSRNTPQVVQAKLKLVKAFKKAKEILAQQQPKPRYYIGMVQEKPKPWDEHFNAEFRYHAQRLTGWDWNWRCMSRFINQTVYNYFPEEVRSELDRVNPCNEKGQRVNKQHQHIAVEEELKEHIKQVVTIMRVSTSLCTFFDSMSANFNGALQQSLF